MRSYEESLIITKYEKLQEHRRWQNEVQVIHFEKEWEVRIIPPFSGAVIRFTIDYNGKHVSVYFDGYSELGWMVDEEENPIPYFEYYDGFETYRYLINETEEMMKDIKNFLES
jgi:hypothetical protein